MKSDRRQFFQTLGAGAAGLTMAPVALPARAAEARARRHPSDEQVLHIGDDIAVVPTAYGKVRGFILRDVYHFRGIPYGADTSGKNRFMPPRKPEPWTDVRPAIWWGNSAPQIMEGRYANPYYAFADHWNYDDVSEDCLRLNVWTPGIYDNARRPVIVWLHGGGFTNGNGIEQDGYKGENLSRYGDVVFCSLNHRLGPIGFSNLAGVGGGAFAASGNVGMLDIVAALEWIRDNIAGFGGDPGNVTIIGQSGGGAKVCTLMEMPAAKGLVHKAVALSGTSLGGLDKGESEELGAYVLREANLQPSQVEQLQQLSWREYIDVANRASRAYREAKGIEGWGRGGFAPVADGVHLPAEPFFSDPASPSADIPLLISTTFHEWAPSRADAALEAITMDGVQEQLAGRFGDQAGAVADAYARAFPGRKPIEILALAASNRQRAVEAADAKVTQGAPVYVAWFGWEPPLFDGRMRAFHCLDICFWFHNTDLMLTHTGGGARPRKLSTMMADALLQFMRTGDPNGGALPAWPRYTPERGETMVLNDVSEVQNDPDREARKALPAT